MKKERKRSSENLTTPKKDYSINLELEEMVLRELENFEISEIYLDSTFNINKLAKQLNTNTSYLSSIVNEKKGKTYKQYIAELRMNYLLNLIYFGILVAPVSIEIILPSLNLYTAITAWVLPSLKVTKA